MSCSVLPNLSLAPLAISKTAWNVAAVSMVSVPGTELASWRSGRPRGRLWSHSPVLNNLEIQVKNLRKTSALPCNITSMPVDSFPYRLMVDELRAEILDGRRPPGSRMPSENQLAMRYSASRPTVRRALAVLKGEGLITTEQGRGAFVRPKPHVRLLVTGANFRKHRTLGLPGFNAQALEQGQRPEQRIRSVATVSASPEVAMRLNLDENSHVVVRRRVF